MNDSLPDGQIRKLQNFLRPTQPPPRPAATTELPPLQGALGKYTLTQRLGPRSWDAVNTKTGKRLVLRILKQNADPASIAEVSKALRPLITLTHPIFVNYHKMSQCDGIHFLVRNYQPGKNFEKPDIAPESALQAFYQLARAIQFAHGRNLIHGSLTPRNVIIDDTGRPFVVDFGIRRLTRHLATDPGRLPLPDLSTDLSDLGILFLSLLSGLPPGKASTVKDLPPFRRISAEVDPMIRDMGQRIMGNNPYTSAGEMADEAGAIYQAIPTEQLPEVGLLQKFKDKAPRKQ